ncbi:MAG: non-homologous end-joining DNA ligase [Candidatus Methanofastidiosia archaeon]
MKKINVLEHLSGEEKSKLKKSSLPSWIDPMLATLPHDYFSDENWIFERKLDGERCLAFCSEGEVRLMSRNKKRLNVHYPELADELSNQKNEVILDGEVVTFEGDVTSFSKLQERMRMTSKEEAQASDIDIFYYLFDITYVNGYDTTGLPLISRKTLLKEALDFEDPVRFLSHRDIEGEKYYKEACEKGWEGVIAKRKDSIYMHKRSTDWLKFKCVNQQEFVIVGYTVPHGERKGFGALLMGYYEDDRLAYAGKEGTGYDDETLRHISDKLAPLEVDNPPFESEDLPHKEVHWVKPELVVEVGFTEWTKHGKLRHLRYIGLREDKEPEDVMKEQPTEVSP